MFQDQFKRNGLPQTSKVEGSETVEEEGPSCSKKAATASRFTICKVHKASRKKREKSSAKRERKATKTLAIVLGKFFPLSLFCYLMFSTFTCSNPKDRSSSSSLHNNTLHYSLSLLTMALWAILYSICVIWAKACPVPNAQCPMVLVNPATFSFQLSPFSSVYLYFFPSESVEMPIIRLEGKLLFLQQNVLTHEQKLFYFPTHEIIMETGEW